MVEKNIELTVEQQDKVIHLDKMLLLACTNDEQTKQIMNIMKKRIEKKEKTMNEPAKTNIV